MRISYNTKFRRPVKANRMPAPRRPIKAEEELVDEEIMPAELLFEATDVADLLAEVTGEEVNMDMDEDKVVFTVGEDEYTVEPEGTEEVLEASRKVFRNKRPVAASRRPAPRKPLVRRK